MRILWLANRADHVDVIERNLHAKVIALGFCSPMSDARWDAAILCALTARPDEARAWFQRAYDMLAAQEAILFLPHVCCDEALMEIRLGHSGDRGNGLRRLAEARRWVETIGLPKLLPRIDDLTAQLAD